MAEEAGVRWTVRGVPMELREAAEQAAGGKHRLGDWLSGAIRRALENLPTAAGAVSEPPPYQARFDELTARVAALEAMIGKQEAPRTRAKAVDSRTPSPAPTAPETAPSPASGEATPASATEKNLAWFKPPKYRLLNAAGIAEIRRRYDAGEADPAIAEAMGITPQGVNKHTTQWRRA